MVKKTTINTKDLAQRVSKWAEKMQECETKNHPNATKFSEVVDRTRHRVYMSCPDCGRIYERTPSLQESKELHKLLYTPMTI